MSLFPKKKKPRPLHSTVYQDKISQFEMDLVITLLRDTESMTVKLPKQKRNMRKLIKRIKEDDLLSKRTKDILLVKLDTLQALIEITLKFVRKPEEITTPEVNPQESSEKDTKMEVA
jgi:hypothetical protein